MKIEPNPQAVDSVTSLKTISMQRPNRICFRATLQVFAIINYIRHKTLQEGQAKIHY